MKSDKIQNPIYSYSDFYSEYFFHNTTGKTKESPEHTLIFVFSGELIVKDGTSEKTVRKGEYIFLRKNAKIILERKACNGESFNSVFLGLNRNFLKEFYRLMNKGCMPTEESQFSNNIIELSRNPYLDSMYVSLIPYVESANTRPVNSVLEIKLMEAVFSLLQIDRKFYYYLFDFLQPWERNNSIAKEHNCDITPSFYDLPLSDSISVIQKDANWLCMFGKPQIVISKKMEADYIQKKGNGKASDIYMEVTYREDARLTGIPDYYNSFPAN